MNSLRIKSLEIRNFRGIRSASISCDADVVLIYGRNGVGKTTIFDAVEYALFGCNRRLEALDRSWQDRLANVHGDGSFSIGLRFQTGEAVNVRRSRDAQIKGDWAGYSTMRDFIYERLMKNKTLGRRNVAAVHDLALATHLLLQSEMAKLAASGTLDAEKLAALTGSGYLERCREKADLALTQLRVRRSETSSRLPEIEERMAQKLGDIRRTTELLVRRDHLVDTLRTHAVTPFTAEILDHIDDRSTAMQLVAMSGRLRDDLRAVERAADVARALLEVPPDTADEAAVKAAVDALRFERQLAVGRRDEVAENVARVRHSLDEHMTAHSGLTSRRELAVETLDDMIRLGQRGAEIPGLTNALTEADAALQQESARLPLAEERVSRAAATLADSVAEHARLQSRVAHVRAVHERCTTATREQNDTQRNIHELTIDVEEARASAEMAARELLDATNSLEQELQSFAAAASDIDRLVSDLRALVGSDDHCPLCGTGFASPLAFRRAIETHAERRSERVAAAQRHLDEQRQRRERAVQTEIAARNRLAALNARLQGFREQESRVRTIVEAATSELSTLVTTPADVAHAIDRLVAETEAAVIAVAHNRSEADDAESSLAAVRETERRSRARASAASAAIAAAQREVASLQTRVRTSSERLGAPADEGTMRAIIADLDDRLQQSAENFQLLRRNAADAETLLAELSRRLSELDQRIGFEEKRLQESAARREARTRQLAMLGLVASASHEEIRAVVTGAEDRIERLRLLADGTEELARVATSATAGDLRSAQTDLEQLQLRRASIEREIGVTDDAQNTLIAWEGVLRRRVDAAVEAFVIPREAEIADTFRSLVADPFRFDGIAIQHESAKGLRLGLIFRNLSEPSGSPEFFLSAAQMSALALAIFLALARSQSWSHLDAILLDDPVQHLDDLDCVALLDGLRNVARQATSKQLIISTCDRSLYHQMIRKFSLSAAPGSSTLLAMSLEEDLRDGVRVRYDVGGPAARASAAS